jgi:hypothetical protein
MRRECTWAVFLTRPHNGDFRLSADAQVVSSSAHSGFKLLAETFTYHRKAGVTYRLLVEKTGGDIRFSVTGNELLRAHDPDPLGGGHLELRTFRAHLWWSNIRLELGSSRNVLQFREDLGHRG